MPKAKITTDTGLNIEVDGTAEDIKAIINYANQSLTTTNTDTSTIQPKSNTVKKSRNQKIENTPTSLVRLLATENYFKPPKSLPQIKEKLTEMGHYYPMTSLSPAVLRLVKKRELRRIKDKKGWVYTI